MTNEQRIWSYFKRLNLTDAGAAGLIGNLYVESALNPQNLQNSYENSLKYDDQSYTDAVDNGDYDKFTTDAAGYGLAQWTYKTRKAGLFALSKLQDKSIGDLDLQLCYIKKEMEKSYKILWEFLKTTNSVNEATIEVMVKYEGPADQSERAKNERIGYARDIFKRNSSIVETDEDGVELTDAPEIAPEVQIEDKKKDKDKVIGEEEIREEIKEETQEEIKEEEVEKEVEEKEEIGIKEEEIQENTSGDISLPAPAEDKQIDIKNNNIYIDYIATEISLGIWGNDWESILIEKIKETIKKKTVVILPEVKKESKDYDYYKVVNGDTLTKIANRYDTSIETIIENNIETYPTITKNYIKVGWILKV